jgi:AraC-like DNA-binding protein/NADH:ubiquinone oxidoreductase subunit K
MELEKAGLLVVLALTAWSALALLLDRRGHAGIHRVFALLLAALCLPQAYFYSRLLQPGGVEALGLAAQATLWLKGPLLWWMVRLAAGQPPRLPAAHLLPFALALAALERWPSSGPAVQGLGALHALAYLLVALGVLRATQPRLVRIWRGHPNTAYYWLLWLAGGMVLLVATDLALVLFGRVRGALPVDLFAWITWPISAWLLAVALAILHRPPRFFRRRRLTDSRAAAPAEDVGAEPARYAATPRDAAIGRHGPDAGTSAERSWRELDENLALPLAARLARLMDEEHLFRDGELSLPRLADRLGISTHQASELLNVHLGIGFYDYLAQRRLDYACHLLRDPACEWRVVDIAFESGFGNKNSFYRQFREACGMAPAEYRQRHRDGTQAVPV